MEVLNTERIEQPAKIKRYFDRYMAMPERSLRGLAIQENLSLSTVCSWSGKYKWQELAEERERVIVEEELKELEKQRRQELVKRIRQAKEARDKSNNNILRLLDRLMNDHEPDILKNIQATQKAVEIVGLNQLACHHELPGGIVTSGETASDDSSPEELQALPFEAGHVQSEDSTAETVLESPSPDMCGDSQSADTDDTGSSG